MTNVRKEWLDALLRIVSPVLNSLEKGRLKKDLPLSLHEERADFAPLEAFGRGMLGLAPWLEAESEDLEAQERALQEKYRAKAIKCIAMATDPDSPDFMVFDRGGQPLVDTAFLAHAIVRAPKALAGSLSPEVRHNLAEAFRSSRQITPGSSNWLFFSAMVEAGLYILGEPYDLVRVLYALRTFQGWYKGDGVYGDGAMLHCDYYNSFVIQPMYVDLVKLFADKSPEIEAMGGTVIARAARYASVLERMIGPEGSYPVVGRSICYRFGAFQMLSQAALQHELEEGVSPASVRCGLTAVIRRVMSAPDMFDEKGWLLPGVYGYQPELAEGYINIGSLYLCSAVFLPLGLSGKDEFWSGAEEEWSGKKVWSGGHISIDHAED
ncbi:MAG: DUF2264 domain-containing protein [Lachnospiraceae bacterium]|nr:DUF2264 domain-containing protein [Lachnospiraceae bacterium]